MKLAIALVSLVAAPAAVGVGYWQGKTGETEAIVAGGRLNAPLIGKPGDGAAEAGKYFAALNAPPPPPPPPPAFKPPPPPPPPDVAVLFRRDLAAVMTGPTGDPRVVLTGSRSLRLGEVYRDGWTLASLSPSTATLTKGKERRNVGLFTVPTGVSTTSSTPVAAAAPPANFAFTNGVRAETDERRQCGRHRLVTAGRRHEPSNSLTVSRGCWRRTPSTPMPRPRP